MKKILLMLFFAANLFAQDQQIIQEKPDVIKLAIERNLDFELVKQAIEYKKPTAEEIKSYFELSTEIHRRYQLSQSGVLGYGFGIFLLNLLYLPAIYSFQQQESNLKLLGSTISISSAMGSVFCILTTNRKANNSKKIYEYIKSEFLKKFELREKS